MKSPAPDHPIAIVPHPGRVRITFGGRQIVETTRALVLKEASYPPVFYVPREDADMGLLSRTDRRTHCPYKGDASYFTIESGGGSAADAVWSYETPLPAVAEIAGHLAFYPDRAKIEML